MTNKKINNNFEQESGRSMVEMLGVLAIIGVLSVGGISGYTTATNKHKANEILNAAAVRAMAVSTQLQNGAETPSLGEFTGTSSVGGATFDDEGTITSSGGKFTIGFTNDGKPSEAVLKQMEQIAGTDGIVRKITDGGLTYNDDLSTEVRASDFDGDEDGNEDKCTTAGYTWCSDLNQCIADGTCGTCENTYTGSTTSTGGTKIGSTNCYCPANSKFTGGKCESSVTKFTVVGSGLTHPKAYNACKEKGMELASVKDVLDAMPGCADKYLSSFYEGCDISQLQYTDNTEGKLGEGSVFYVWLNECWSEDGSATGDECPASYYVDGNPKNKMIETGTISGRAWYVDITGDITSYGRGDVSTYALCE